VPHAQQGVGVPNLPVWFSFTFFLFVAMLCYCITAYSVPCCTVNFPSFWAGESSVFCGKSS